MENAINGIFNTYFLAFAVVVALAVILVRKVFEAIFSKAKSVLPDKIEDFIMDIWRQWVLRALPVFLGGLMAFIFSAYPFPDAFGQSSSGRVFFGLIAGLFSSPIYSVIKFHIKKHLPDNVKAKIDNMNPLSK